MHILVIGDRKIFLLSRLVDFLQQPVNIERLLLVDPPGHRLNPFNVGSLEDMVVNMTRAMEIATDRGLFLLPVPALPNAMPKEWVKKKSLRANISTLRAKQLKVASYKRAPRGNLAIVRQSNRIVAVKRVRGRRNGSR